MKGQYALAPSCLDSSKSDCGQSPLAGTASTRPQQITHKLLAGVAAAMLVTASAGFGALYAWGVGSEHGLAFAVLAVVMALGLECAKPLAIASAFHAFASWRFGTALAMFALGGVAVVYSLTAELSLLATARGDKAAERQAANVRASNVEAERTRLTAELAAITQARPSAAINAELAALLTDRRLDNCEGWLASVRLRTRCIERVAPLKAELAAAERRERLEAGLAKLRTTDGGAQVKPDPAAHALATYLSALGFKVEPAAVSEWLVLVPVLALEVGSAFAGLLAGGIGPNRVGEACSSATTQPPPQAIEISAVPAVEHHVQTLPAKLHVPDDPGERLLQVLRERGGEVVTGQRMLAKALGVSTGAVNGLLRDLGAAGRLQVQTSRLGTMLSLPA